METLNEGKLTTLLCSTRNRFRDLVSQIENKGYTVTVTSGSRSLKEQAEQYNMLKNNAAGRAAKPGSSKHNFGIAIDINVTKDGHAWRKATSKEDWLKTGIPELAEKLGFRWGGEFSGNYDPVHFDLGNDFRVKELSNQLEYTKNVPVSTQLSCMVEDFYRKYVK